VARGHELEEDTVKRTRALLTAALPVALVAALTLTGCSSGSKSDGADCAPSGKASDSVKVTGDLGKELKLDSKTPVTVTALERTVAIDGDGDEIGDGESVSTNLALFNGKTGETLQPSTPTTVTKNDQLSGWAKSAINCAAVGDRVVVVDTAKDVFGAGVGAQYKLDDADALIMVLDFTGTVLNRAEGKAVKAPADFPSVKLGDDGAPTITIPKGEKAPTELKIANLIEGDGETVKDGDSVTVQYRGVIWRTGEEFDASWTNGSPATFLTNQVIPGFTKALVGQKVGSQVIAVIPAEDGYGKDTATKISGAKNDDVLVFVVDILSTTHAAG